MLGAGDDLVRSAVVTALKSANARARHLRTEERIFTRAFSNSSPARVARDINHRRERPVNARSSCFRGGNAGRAFCRRGIPGCRFAERYRKDGAITMNDIETEDERNLQTRFGQGHALEFIGL